MQYLIFGISIGIPIGMGIMFFIMRHQGRKMFLHKPYKKKASLLADQVYKSLKNNY